MEKNNEKKRKMWTKRQCTIKGCTVCAGSGIPLHRFPREEKMLIKWIEASNVNSVSLHTLICGLHFKPSDYINLAGKKRVLKTGTIPSLFNSDNSLNNKLNKTGYEDFMGYYEEETDSADDSNMIEMKENDCENCNNTGEINNINSEVNKDICVVHKEVQTEKKVTVDKEIQTRFSLVNIMSKDSDLRAFTGIDFSVLDALVKAVNLIKPENNDKHVCTLKERIVLTIIKLRINLAFKCLSVMFGVSESTASNYFLEMIPLLASVLEEIVYLPDKEEIMQNLPVHFHDFKDTRIILDCTEIQVENLKCLQCRLKMYSHYKGKQTVKFLIGVAPSGLISYCSKAYGGRASDKAIFFQSGLLDKMTPGEDAIMVDKGFLIQEECDSRKIKLYRPPFATKTEQMSSSNAIKTKSIASARVHIERIMERLKNFYILKSVIDGDMIKYLDLIMKVICGLVNLSRPIIDKTRYCN